MRSSITSLIALLLIRSNNSPILFAFDMSFQSLVFNGYGFSFVINIMITSAILNPGYLWVSLRTNETMSFTSTICFEISIPSVFYLHSFNSGIYITGLNLPGLSLPLTGDECGSDSFPSSSADTGRLNYAHSVLYCSCIHRFCLSVNRFIYLIKFISIGSIILPNLLNSGWVSFYRTIFIASYMAILRGSDAFVFSYWEEISHALANSFPTSLMSFYSKSIISLMSLSSN